jgi:hypothetical protein
MGRSATVDASTWRRIAEEAPTSNASIKLQILLRSEWRNPEGVDKVRQLLSSLGMTPTAAGLATLSAELDAGKFKATFGVTAAETPPASPAKADFGRSGGYVSQDLKVPAALSEFVQSISAAPSHLYLEK